MTLRVKQWGNSLGIILPTVFIKQLGINKGQELELIPNDEGFFLKIKPIQKCRKYTLEELVNQCELSAPKSADVWQNVQNAGREQW